MFQFSSSVALRVEAMRPEGTVIWYLGRWPESLMRPGLYSEEEVEVDLEDLEDLDLDLGLEDEAGEVEDGG